MAVIQLTLSLSERQRNRRPKLPASTGRQVLAEHEVTIELSDEAKEMLVEKGYDPAMGARPLRRAIQRLIEDPLADFVLGRSLEPSSTIVVKRKNEEEVDIEVIPPISAPEPAKVGATASKGDGTDDTPEDEPATD